eukprot:4569382-Pyramimonas_sp.AAC.1
MRGYPWESCPSSLCGLTVWYGGSGSAPTGNVETARRCTWSGGSGADAGPGGDPDNPPRCLWAQSGRVLRSLA